MSALARRWPWTVPLTAQLKALVAGLLAAAASTITAALADGRITGPEARAIVGAALAGYLVTFAVRNRATGPREPREPEVFGGVSELREMTEGPEQGRAPGV